MVVVAAVLLVSHAVGVNEVCNAYEKAEGSRKYIYRTME